MKRYIYISLKKSLLTLGLVGLFIGVWGQCASNLIISEYIEGSGSEKYIEIYNGTGASVDLSDFRLRLYANGAAAPTSDVLLSGILVNNGVIVYKNSAATLYAGGTINAAVNFNGDDAIALYKISTTSFVDIVGNIGCDPGAAWVNTNTTLDKTLVRNIAITGGVTIDDATSCPFPTLASDWTQYNIDDVSHLGSHNMSCGSTLIVAPSSLSAFTYFVGSGPSASQSYSLSGTGLTGFPSNIVVTGSTNYEVSLNNSTFFSSVNVPYGSVTLAATTIYVRLKTGLVAGTYNGETISNAGGGATTQNVTCNGTVTASSASDIITANGESATISSIINTTGPLTSAQGTQVWQFTIRDGGAGLNDADNLSSIVNAITFSQAAGDAVGNWSTAIQAIDLFDGATNVGSGTVISNQVQFTGLNIIVADNSQKTISVRLTLKCPLGAGNLDGDDFGFQISNTNVTFSSSGSGKTAFTAISTSNGQNAIAIIATQLSFNQQPTSTGTNQNMTPNVTVAATDVCGNTDLGFTGSISITSAGTLTGSPVSGSAVAGVSIFGTLIHTVVGTGLTLTASATGLTSATSSIFDIYVVTTFGAGDIAIVGMCVNMGLCGGVSGEDEISFVSFEDIAPGTSIDLTDNGFERVGCGTSNWGNTEGVVRITRTTSTIPKGTIITLRIMDQTVFTPLQPDANWTVTYPNSGFGQFNLNNNDEQVYIMQGGTWNKGTINTHDATYVGGVLMFGINTFTSWTCNDNTTTRGNLPLALRCYSILPGIVAINLKYTGLTTPATQKDWIDRLNSVGNWSGSATCAIYATQGLDYSGVSQVYSIVASGFTPGTWTGATSTDWFDCNNWQNYKVPDLNTSVTIPNVANDPIIGASPALYPSGAYSSNLTINSDPGVLTINNALSVLNVYGNIVNNGSYVHTNGVVNIRNANSTLSSTSTMSFYNLNLSKTANSNTFTIGSDISISNNLTLTSGILSTGINKVVVTNTLTNAVSGFGANSYINGNLRRNVASTGSYDFPVGTLTNYEASNINLKAGTSGISYIDAKFTNPHSTAIDITSLGLVISSTPITTLLDYGFWTIAPDAGTYNYDVTITSRGHTNGGTVASQHTIVKRANNTVDWATYQSNHSNLTQVGTGSSPITAVLSGLTTFCDFAIARSSIAFPLPIELTMFAGKSLNKQVLLNWQTASETNNDYFEVFKSKDLSYFEKLGTIAGAGNSNSTNAYSFIDENPYAGINYYKIKQVDFDGNFSESNYILVQFQEAGEISIYYNNANSILVSNTSNKIDIVEITDITGKLVTKLANNYEEGQLQINVDNITPGIYFVKVICNNETTVRKIFIE